MVACPLERLVGGRWLLHLIGGFGDSPVGKQHSGKPLSANHVALQKRHKTSNYLTKALLIGKITRGLIYLCHAFLDELDPVC